MPQPETHNEAEIPSREELNLADYKLSWVLADVEDFTSRLEQLAGPITVKELKEYVARSERGETIVEERHDPDAIAHLAVFAAQLNDDSIRLAEYAAKIQRHALTLYHLATDDQAPEYRERVRAWHRQEVERA